MVNTTHHRHRLTSIANKVKQQPQRHPLHVNDEDAVPVWHQSTPQPQLSHYPSSTFPIPHALHPISADTNFHVQTVA